MSRKGTGGEVEEIEEGGWGVSVIGGREGIFAVVVEEIEEGAWGVSVIGGEGREG